MLAVLCSVVAAGGTPSIDTETFVKDTSGLDYGDLFSQVLLGPTI